WEGYTRGPTHGVHDQTEGVPTTSIISASSQPAVSTALGNILINAWAGATGTASTILAAGQVGTNVRGSAPSAEAIGYTVHTPGEDVLKQGVRYSAAA